MWQREDSISPMLMWSFSSIPRQTPKLFRTDVGGLPGLVGVVELGCCWLIVKETMSVSECQFPVHDTSN